MMAEAVEQFDLSAVDEMVARIGRGRHNVIALLQAIQDHFHYLPEPVLERLCAITDISASQVVGVATFYSQFRFTPLGKHRIRVCHGTACHVKGSARIHDSLHRALEIPDNADTDSNKLFTVEKVACLGCCTLAPVVQIDDVVYGHLTPEKIPRMLKEFLDWTAKRGQSRDGSDSESDVIVPGDMSLGEVRIGLGSCCVAKKSDRLRQSLEDELASLGLSVPIKRVGCVGMCYQTPLVEVVSPSGKTTIYSQVSPEDARAIVLKHFKPKGIVNKARYALLQLFERALKDEAWEPVARYSLDTRDAPVKSFLGRQVHIATEHFGVLNPFDLTEYQSFQGFEGLEKCIRMMQPEQVIEEIERSGLRGRGGAGFPSGLKWRKVRESEGSPKYVICNGDEGDPGAFMDRMLLESFPFRVIEGMAIAAYAVGANEGIFYIRAEYPLALKAIRAALAVCESKGLLGKRLFGTDYSFNIRVAEGAGAFVSGEETALLASLEGRRSTPRLRPPYPAEEGLWKKPTLINNVETYSLVPWIICRGADAFSELGTESSSGTKVFALAGKVERGGLIEVPMGISIRDIVEQIGGGVAGGKRLKAVQVGGPSGGCVPAEMSDTAIDFEALNSVGAIMGSGGLVVLDESDCMVDISRYFMEFTQRESCGKCTFCRIGSKRMLEILIRLCEGKSIGGDLERLENLGQLLKKASFCGLGKTAPNPVLTSLRYFRKEYEAHLDGHCPAGKCRALIQYEITQECIGCTLCAQHCPVAAIRPTPYEKHVVNADLCVRCDTCRTVCPEKAVQIVSGPYRVS